jgi:hypothetical protein
VNGSSLKAGTVPKKGIVYSANLTRSPSYEMHFAKGNSETRLMANERKFEVSLPRKLSVGSDLIIPFTGEPLSSREKLLVKLTSPKPLFSNGRRKTIVLTAVLDGGKIIISSSASKNFRPGPARLLVALSSDQSPQGAKDQTLFTIKNEAAIEISKH